MLLTPVFRLFSASAQMTVPLAVPMTPGRKAWTIMHPRVRREWDRSCENRDSRQARNRSEIIPGMPEDEDEIHPGFGQQLYTAFNSVCRRLLGSETQGRRQRSQQCDRSGVRSLFEPGSSEQDVPDGTLTFEGKKGQARQRGGIVKKIANEFSFFVVAEGGTFQCSTSSRCESEAAVCASSPLHVKVSWLGYA